MNLPVEKFPSIVELKYTDMKKNEAEGTESLIRYMRTTAPMVSDRDTVVGVFSKYDENGKLFQTSRSIEDDKYPDNIKNVIRMYFYESYEMFDSEEDGVPVANLVGFNELDVKGNIPPSLINMSNANSLFKHFKTTMKVMNAK